jgi:hypothetical protein
LLLNKIDFDNPSDSCILCQIELIAMRTKRIQRTSNKTILPSSFTCIGSNKNREHLRSLWRSFLREMWHSCIPFDEEGNIHPIQHKLSRAIQTCAESWFAKAIYEIVFCGVFGMGKCKYSTNLSSRFKINNGNKQQSTSKSSNNYIELTFTELIPCSNGKKNLSSFY